MCVASAAVRAGGRGEAMPLVELSRSLLNAKLAIPEPRTDTVSRRPLIDAARSSACRVVGVTAPAGYGKSTLMAEWAAADERPVGWVTFDRFDNDPTTF
ncbi:MAG: hypothetical protein ABWX92_04100, partial [Mycetocola sp.]